MVSELTRTVREESRCAANMPQSPVESCSLTPFQLEVFRESQRKVEPSVQYSQKASKSVDLESGLQT